MICQCVESDLLTCPLDCACPCHALRARVEELEGALRIISDPVAHLKSRVPAGHIFNAQAALDIAHDPNWLMGIARAALAGKGEG